jgi:hypothetical protein
MLCGMLFPLVGILVYLQVWKGEKATEGKQVQE